MRQSARGSGSGLGSGSGAEPERSDSERAERSPKLPEPGAASRRLPALSMLSAHILHSDYMQPVPATPLSPIELDAKKSPLALLAQTCSQIGKPDPQPPSKLGLVGSGGKESPRPSSCLKLGEAAAEDKSSFKPYSKVGDGHKDGGEKAGFRVPGGSCRPPSLPAVGSPVHGDVKSGEMEEKKEAEGKVCREHSPSGTPHGRSGAEVSQSTTPAPAKGEVSAGLVPGHVAPVSPYKPGHSVYALPPSSMGYHGSMVGGFSSAYPSQFVGGVEPKPAVVGSSLTSAVGCPIPAGKSANSSPLTGASPPSFIQGLCRDPYCLTYHSAPHLGGSGCSSCLHDPPSLKTGYPLIYPSHPLHSSVLSTGSTPPLAAHPLYTYGFMLHSDPRPHICNWVSASGPCDKRFTTSEELLSHLRTHTALPGAEKLLAHYPSPASCGLHLPQGPPGSPNGLALRSPHTLALGRYHPYSKSHLPTPTSSVLNMPAASPYYSPYTLYGQQLTSASALGYQ